MARPIPLALEAQPTIEIDAALVAPHLGLSIPDFRQRMEDRKIPVLCERGTGTDAGLYRATFYCDGKRVRLVVDSEGRLLADPDVG